MIYKRIHILLMLLTAIPLSARDMFPARQLTIDPAQEGFATWSPDSKSIVYQHTDKYSDTLGKNGLWKISVDGTDAKQISIGLAEHPKWSPDGKKIAFTRTQGRNLNIWVMDADTRMVKRNLQK